MADKKSEEEKQEEKKAGKESAKKAAAKKPAAKKTPSKDAAKKKPRPEPEAAQKPTEEEEAAAQRDEGSKSEAEEETQEAPATERDEELSEEELRRLVEESMEMVTVADIVLNIMNQLASVGYMKMGIPESVNLKYRDFDQAGLAIDTLEAMIKGAEGKVPEEFLQPFKGTLANLQMNFVQLKRQ
jgi:hypothetical protein